MRLLKVCGQNFMGGTFSAEFAALNIGFGGNDKGKTRLANLIKLLLLGSLPGLDKTPRAIFDALSSAQRMDIEGAFDTGIGIHRSWEQKGERVTAAKHVPEALDGTTPLVLLDASDYFSRSARGRVEMIFSVARIAGAFELIGQILSEMAAAENIGKFTADELYSGTKPQNATDPQEWIERALEWAEQKRSDAAADVRRYTQTLQGLTSLQLNDRPATRSVEDIDAEIEREQEAAATKKARRTTLSEAMRNNEALEIERDDLQHRITSAGDPPDKEYNIPELRQRAAALTKKRDAAKRQQDAHDEWSRKEGERREELPKVQGAIERIEKDLARIPDLEAQISRLEPEAKTKVCPTCKRSYTPGTAAHPKARPIREEIVRIKIAAEHLDEKRERLAEIADPLPEPLPPADNLAVVQAELDEVQAEIDEYDQTVEVRAWKRQLAELPKSADHADEIARLGEEAEAHENRVTALREERKAAESDRQDRKRLAEAQEEQEKAITAEANYKAAKQFLLSKKAELIKTVFGPLLDIAGRFMHKIFPQPVEYRDGELGMFNGGSWVPEAAFGGAKRALTHAALQCALGANSPCRIILMDELLNIVTHLAQFLENVRGANEAGIVEQFIGLIPTGDLFPPAQIPRVKDFLYIEADGKGYIPQ